MTYTKSGLAAAVLFLAALLFPAPLPAQVMFERTYGGEAGATGQSVQQTTDGGYVAVGSADNDVYLIKTDSLGDTLWTRTFGGDSVDQGQSVQQTTDGGYIVVGGANFEDEWGGAYVIKTDPNGDTVWTRIFRGSGSDCIGYSVQQTTDGGYVIAGQDLTPGLSYQLYLVKTDSLGDTLWTREFGGADPEMAFSVRQTSDSGYIITGLTVSYGAGYEDVWLVKTDANGDTMWTRTYGGPGPDAGHSVRQTADGGYIIAGWTYLGAGYADVYLVRTDAGGDTLWTRTFGGTDDDLGGSVQQTTDGGYVIAGSTRSFGAGREDVWLIKIDAAGGTQWSRTYGDTAVDGGSSVQQTRDGGFIITGYASSESARIRLCLIKTDSLGRTAVEEPETPPTRAPGLSLSSSPNPASGSVTISLSPSTPLSLPALLRLFDATGRLVLSQPVRTSPFVLHPSSLPAGVYLARLDFGARHASTRLVLER